jgi:DNA-binding NtrC family response regulator
MSSAPRLLLVDDEERFRTTLSKLLGVRGIPVAAVGSGEEALAELRSKPYDVILLDVRMPGMNGVEVLAEIKKINPALEVIILTGHASVDAAADIMKLGGYDYLLKPCSVDELMDKIDGANERKLAREKRKEKASAPQVIAGEKGKPR